MICSVSGEKHGVRDHLVGSVEKTGSSSFQQEVLIVCDAAFGEPARMLDSEKKVEVIFTLPSWYHS